MLGSSGEVVGGSNGFPLEKVRSRTFSLVLAVGVGLDWGFVRWIAEGSGKLVGVVGDVRSSGAARGGRRGSWDQPIPQCWCCRLKSLQGHP